MKCDSATDADLNSGVHLSHVSPNGGGDVLDKRERGNDETAGSAIFGPAFAGNFRQLRGLFGGDILRERNVRMVGEVLFVFERSVVQHIVIGAEFGGSLRDLDINHIGSTENFDIAE